MKVFVSTGVKDIAEKAKWFERPVCDQLRKVGIEFGFEIKDSPKGLENLSYPYGIHLPYHLASEWRDPLKKENVLQKIENVADLEPKPLYAVLHGIRISRERTDYRKPPTEKEEKFISSLGAEDYLTAAEELINFIKYLMSLGIPVVLETVYFTNYAQEDGVALAKTFLLLRVGALGKDVQKIMKETGCGSVVDWEHLFFALNFAKRRFNYANLPNEIPENISQQEKRLIEEFGVFVSKNRIPVIPEANNLSFEKEVEKIGAKIFHVCGTYRGRFIEFDKEKVTSHCPIYLDDLSFRKYLGIALRENPEILTLEVARPMDNPCYGDRPPNVQEESFENFCQILIEEL